MFDLNDRPTYCVCLPVLLDQSHIFFFSFLVEFGDFLFSYVTEKLL
jgi:hypothetical protein